MSVPSCHHLKEDGVYCNSPALKGRDYCYFHLNLRGRQLKSAQARRRGASPALYLPFPEDMHAVQIGLAELMWALAQDRIETKKAWALLSMLQQASSNLTRTPNWQGERPALAEHRPLRATNDPGFERRHGLPQDADLDAASDTACDPPTGCPTSASFAGVGPCANASSPGNTTPDCVPLPADELRTLNVTRLDQLEFFMHKFKYDNLTDEQERVLFLQWLRQRRAEEAADPALAEERRQLNATWASRPHPAEDAGESEAA